MAFRRCAEYGLSLNLHGLLLVSNEQILNHYV